MFETIEVTHTEVACDGGNGALGHPRVYLHTDPDKGDKITCPYCSRTYVLKIPALKTPVHRPAA